MRSTFKFINSFALLLVFAFLVHPAFSQENKEAVTDKEKAKIKKYEEVIPDTAISKNNCVDLCGQQMINNYF